MDETLTIRHSALAALLVGLWLTGCAETATPQSPEDRFGQGSQTQISDPIPYTERSSSFDIQGETSIRTLLEASVDKTSDPVWYGYGEGDPIPTGETREFEQICESNYGNKVFKLDILPATIRGVVTIPPNQYLKPEVCGQDRRYYGSYILQDATGALKIAKDSEVADFQIGDVVEVRVLGLYKNREMKIAIAFDSERVVAEAGTSGAPGVPFEHLEQDYNRKLGIRPRRCPGTPPEGLGNNFRISGRICQTPNSRNFGVLQVQKGDAECGAGGRRRPEWAVSLTPELSRRKLGLDRGDPITVTGPLYGGACSWGLQMLVTTPGQFQKFQ